MENPYKKCPNCGERNIRSALRCKKCKEWFSVEGETVKDYRGYSINDSNDYISETNESILKPFIYIVLIGIFFFCIFIKSSTTTVYIKTDGVKLCRKANVSYCYKELKLLEPLEVYSFYKSNGYLKTKGGDYIKEAYVTQKDTKEYNQVKYKKEKEEKRALESRRKKLAAAAHFFEENFIEIFTNIDLEYLYDFYINPIGWQIIPYENKKILIQYCAMYAEYKKGRRDSGIETIYMTRILSDRNGEVLGEFNAWKGYVFK